MEVVEAKQVTVNKPHTFRAHRSFENVGLLPTMHRSICLCAWLCYQNMTSKASSGGSSDTIGQIAESMLPCWLYLNSLRGSVLRMNQTMFPYQIWHRRVVHYHKSWLRHRPLAQSCSVHHKIAYNNLLPFMARSASWSLLWSQPPSTRILLSRKFQPRIEPDKVC